MKSFIKKILPNRMLFWYQNLRRKKENPVQLSSSKLLSLIRHEAHRIEKTHYNEIFAAKYNTYLMKRNDIYKYAQELEKRGLNRSEPSLAWALDVCEHFDDLESNFIMPRSLEAPAINIDNAIRFSESSKRRRSVRVWSDTQPDDEELMKLSSILVNSAITVPTSGNRQPWRFKIIIDQQEKDLLKGLKEAHCYNAPLLVFIGMDARLYGAFSKNESGLYIDAGAVVMQMLTTAHLAGYGTCWNHFAKDLIESRSINVEKYANFVTELDIPTYIEPVAILAVGKARFIPPVPERMNTESYYL